MLKDQYFVIWGHNMNTKEIYKTDPKIANLIVKKLKSQKQY